MTVWRVLPTPPAFVPPIPSSQTRSHHRTTPTCSHTPPTRRTLLLALAALPLVPHQSLAKNFFDEESLRAAEAETAFRATRIAALRRGFDAVASSSAQIADLSSTTFDESRALAVELNNDVVREGMVPIEKGLPERENKTAALALCGEDTKAFVAVSKAAKAGEEAAVKMAVGEAVDALEEFGKLAPAEDKDSDL